MRRLANLPSGVGAGETLSRPVLAFLGILLLDPPLFIL